MDQTLLRDRKAAPTSAARILGRPSGAGAKGGGERELMASDIAAGSLVVRTSAFERALFAVIGIVSDQVFRALEDPAVRVVHDQGNIGGPALQVTGRRAVDQTLRRDRKAQPARAAQLLGASVRDALEPDVDRDGAPRR